MLRCIFLLSFLFSIQPNIEAQKNYHEVTLPEVMEKFQTRDTNLVIVDVRTRGEYADTGSSFQQGNIGHIKGAINIPLQDFRKDPSIVHELDAYRDKEIYLLCSHSYRSRVVSELLLDSGFTHVNNIRGGMTEFYRRYDDLQPYRNDWVETKVKYQNISPAQLVKKINAGKKILIIGIGNAASGLYDSLSVMFNQNIPSFKKALYFDFVDSLKILEMAKKENAPVVLYNTTNYGAAELALWLQQKGVPDVAFLVGNMPMFYEYIVNENLVNSSGLFMKKNSSINFITPPAYCSLVQKNAGVQMIDLREDSLFNTATTGTKYNYSHLKNALQFSEKNGAAAFKKTFPDKSIKYVFISQYGMEGLALADELSNKGYNISWMIGGLRRWEWFMNNDDKFDCMKFLVN